MANEWPLWEIFIRGQHGLNHRHVGSLHAPDAEMAINNARDVYTRRKEGVSIWVARSTEITASTHGLKVVQGNNGCMSWKELQVCGIDRDGLRPQFLC